MSNDDEQPDNWVADFLKMPELRPMSAKEQRERDRHLLMSSDPDTTGTILGESVKRDFSKEMDQKRRDDFNREWEARERGTKAIAEQVKQDTAAYFPPERKSR